MSFYKLCRDGTLSTDYHNNSITTEIKRICEGKIEKFVTRITDWHHKAC